MLIRIFPLLFLLVFGSFSGKGFAGMVVISGHSPEYKGDSLIFIYSVDPFTGYTEVAGKTKINQDGDFKISFECRVIRQINVGLGKVQGYFFVEPGKHYHILLPPKRPKTDKDILNPYFKSDFVQLGIADIAEDDLNMLIHRFDKQFTPFFNKYALDIYTRNSKPDTERFKRSIDSSFAGIEQLFFLDYMKFRMDELEFLELSGIRKQKLYTRFATLTVANNNAAFYDLFNRIYKRFLYNIVKLPENKVAIIAIYRDKSYTELKAFLKERVFFESDRLLELAVLKGIYEEFFQSDFPKEGLLELLEGLKKSTSVELHKRLATYIRWKVTHLDPGSPAPKFKLLNAEKKWVSLDDFKGRFVYLNFASFQSYACQTQFPDLGKLAEKYKKNLAVVSIIVDKTPEDMISRKELYSYNWNFLYLGDHSDLPGKYNVRAYPTYILIDRNSLLHKIPAPSPLEGFDNFFEEILSEKK
jgi:peroxiredoxin